MDDQPLKGDLEHVEVRSRNIELGDQRTVDNNWREFTEDELSMGPNGDLSRKLRFLVDQAAEGAFDGVNFENLGYYDLGSTPKSNDSES